MFGSRLVESTVYAMSLFTTVDTSKLIGAEIDNLSFDQHFALTGQWIALEVYTPKTRPIRRIAAVADSAADCMNAIASQGLDPAQFEFSKVTPPY